MDIICPQDVFNPYVIYFHTDEVKNVLWSQEVHQDEQFRQYHKNITYNYDYT